MSAVEDGAFDVDDNAGDAADGDTGFGVGRCSLSLL